MSCNGCRVLRKGCGEACVLRTCLQWIDSPDAQGNATLFLAKFFGRSDLLSFIAAVPHHQRPALFQSLLFEACGRTVNPVNGAVGLLSSGNWHVCQAAVETVIHGGALRPMQGVLAPSAAAMDRSANRLPAAIDRSVSAIGLSLTAPSSGSSRGRSGVLNRSPMSSDESVGFGIGDRKERKLLNLFV